METTNIFIQAPTEAGHGTPDDSDGRLRNWENDPFSTPSSSRPPSVIASRYSDLPNATPSGSGSGSGSGSRSSNETGSSPSLNGYPRAQASSTSVATPRRLQQRMKSHMITDFDNGVPKPWLEKKNPRNFFAYWIVYFLVFLGLSAGGIQAYFKYTGVLLDRQPLCLVMEENFDSEESVFGPNGFFFREANMDGFGTGEFDMATLSQNNSYIQDGKLYIVPTLTSDNLGVDAVFDGTVYNITGCTFNQTRKDEGFIISPNGDKKFDLEGYTRSCSAISNKTAGTVINPVQSARLSTKGKASIRYGRVDVRAKLPTGDWMWPAIWMLPVDEVYGPWPRSGEIDIVESRGNGIRYTARGSNYVQGSLNWGPNTHLNGVSKTYSWWSDKRTPFSNDFHTYTLEWTEKFLRISVDTRLHTLLELKFDKPFFERGQFPSIVYEGPNPTALQNPWINGTNATPFDQDFYLILNVAVGSSNGWFPESQGNKPWLDNAANPMRDFGLAVDKWYPTWPSKPEDRAMIVDYVKMWKHC